MNSIRKTALAVLVCSSCIFADYASTKVKVGAYYLDSKEDSVSQSIFQQHSLNAAIEKSGAFAKVSGSYSELYKNRGAEYKTDYRLSLAKAGYKSSENTYSAAVGRMYTSLIDRTAWWDGMELKYQIKNLIQAHAFGGYAVPTVYDNDFMNSDSEYLAAGGSLLFKGIKNVSITSDYLKISKDDYGTAGLGANVSIGNTIGVKGAGVWEFNDNFLQHGSLITDVAVRKSDKALFSYTYDAAEQDTTRYFDILLHPDRNVIEAGYYYHHCDEIQAALNYGVLLYDDEVAHMIETQVMGLGAYLIYTQEFESYTNMMEITVGYEREIISDLLFGFHTGYMMYQLSEKKDDHTALVVAVEGEYAIFKNLKLSVEYEFLQNREYSQDNRVFAGLNYSFYKGL